jgi:branched-chain amino acid transport system permease protein
MLVKFFIFALFAMSLSILIGWVGLFSLGHAAFFGISAYTATLLIVRWGVISFWLAGPAGILIATLLSAIVGLVVLRIKGTVYFLMITLATGELLYGIAITFGELTGGSNGLVGIGLPNLSVPGYTMTYIHFYYLVLIVSAICLFLLYRLSNSPFGQALRGIRENERRMENLGYNVWLYKYMSFVVAGFFAGVAGVLFPFYSGIVAPQHLGIDISALALTMVLVGGAEVFLGAFLGTAVMIPLQHIAAIYTPERWPIILGAVLVLSVIFFKGGLSAYLLRVWKKVKI